MSKYYMKQPLFIAILLPVLAGCSENMDDLYAYIDETKSSHVGSVDPIPQFRPYESFAYSAADLRDPFEPNIDLEEEQAQASENLLSPDRSRPRQPLEAFPLDTLRMVGVLEQGDNLWGLVEDPKQVVHRVKLGNYMGKNEGRIVAITETDITLVEIIPDGIGGYIERDASLAIGQ